MKFTRLKLHGFKSFCDQSDLILEPGLTGVVGPNGCGKSNLVEALRWVMGESSYKAMRAAGMDEVIFSGSANRPSRNSAEVTLVLDNSDRTAPAQLNNADILEVTRRIERDAGSVYRVNGRDVRARDVQLLFADASTGAHSPALVRQGQIGELIAAKPQQRRALLEEAAGISGLHSRRHEAELRLRAAEQNLDRVDDIIAQVELQLENLKKQARLATRYRNISGDIRKAEATLFHLRWVATRVAEREGEAEQGRLIRQLADAASGEQAALKARSAAEETLEPLRMAEAEAGAARQKLQLMRAQIEEERERLNQRRNELTGRAAQLSADKAREQALFDESGEILEACAADTKRLNEELSGQSGAEEKAKAEATKSAERLQSAERVLKEQESRLATLRAERAQLERNLSDAQTRLDRISDQITSAEETREKLEAQAGADTRIVSAQAELAAAQADAEKTEQTASHAEKSFETVQLELETIRPRLAEAESALGKLQSEADTLARMLNLEAEGLWPPVGDLLKVEPGYETALGAVLGSDLEASGDSGAPLNWQMPEPRTADPQLPEGVTPFSKFVSAPEFMTRRLAQIGLVDETAGPALAKNLSPGQRLVAKSGAYWRWDGLSAAADAPSSAAQRLAQRNRLAELDDEIGTARRITQQRQNDLQAVSERLEQARLTQKDARENSRAAHARLVAAHEALEAAQSANADFARRQSANGEALTRLAAEDREVKNLIESIRESLRTAPDIEELAGTVDAAQRELVPLRAAAAEAQAILATLDQAAASRKDQLSRIALDEQNWQRRRSGAQSQLTALVERHAAIAAELENIQSAPDALAERQSVLDDQLAEADQKLKRTGDALATAQAALRDADQTARAAAGTLAGIREQLARTEERLKSQLAQRQQIERAVLETLDIRADKTGEIAGLRPDQPLPAEEPTERKLERLKAERERLGGVNLAAEREMEEVGEKLQTMVSDREELVAAIAKLRTGISTLNREGRTRLNEAFVKVNAHFRELFTSLFGGGTAELSFVESDDPLEAGLEIIARPPGKKPQTMTLLSGGEQALTALSLIFAVFLTNPAPICVLDEVDAPLDDANVERFCNLLDTMCERTDTRFMVITHNPITMSRVDRLFGVTMAERGVSQLVSVDLTSAHAIRESA